MRFKSDLLNEFLDGLTHRRPEPLLGRDGGLFVNWTNWMKRVAQIEEYAPRKAFEILCLTQHFRRGERVEVLEQVSRENVGSADGGWGRKQHRKKQLEPFFAGGRTLGHECPGYSYEAP